MQHIVAVHGVEDAGKGRIKVRGAQNTNKSRHPDWPCWNATRRPDRDKVSGRQTLSLEEFIITKAADESTLFERDTGSVVALSWQH